VLATIRKSQITVSLATLAAALLLIACAAPAADATPTWLAPHNVFSTPVTSIQDDTFSNRKALDVVSDSEGDAVAVWIEEHPKNPGPGTECQAMYAFRNPGQSFGAPQPLAPVMAFCTGQVKAAINANDTTVVAWQQGDEIDAAIRPPFGPFGAPTTLSASVSTDDPWVAINAAGVAAVSWDDENTGTCPGLTASLNWVFHASIRQPGGGFGPFETVCDTSHLSGPTIYTPRVVVDPQGDVVATWVNQFNDGTGSHDDVESAFRPAGGPFNAATRQVLADMLNPVAESGSFTADIAVDAQGRATAVWPFFNGAKTVIETATRPPGASSMFGSAGPVSDPLAAGDTNSPRVAVDPATNTAVAVWIQCPSSCQVEGAARPSGGGFQAPQALSGGGATTTFGPLVAFDPSGGATAIWSGPSPDVAGTQVQVARRPPGSNQPFGAVTTLSTDDPSESPAIAFDGEGNAIAVWEHHSVGPPSTVLEYAGFDAAPPDIRSVSAPSGAAGKTLSFSANVSDRWSASTVSWNFGDGGTATGTAVTHKYTKHGSYTVVLTARDAVGNASTASRSVAIAGGHKPTPRVKLSVTFHASGGRHGSARFKSLAIKVSSGTKVKVLCIGKHKGCPFKAKTVKTKRGKADVAKLLKHHRLAAGAILEIRATKRGTIGRVANLTVQHGTGVLSFLCLPIGKRKARAHCSG
jgi:hypothetical protein